jgi:type IV pilus assembly protein PilM
VDISTASVKVLELSRERDTYHVECLAMAPLALPGSATDKTLGSVELIGEVLKSVVKLSGTRTRAAAAAVPYSAVITKMITMPSTLSGEELELQVELEADRYVPYPLEEVSLDFEVQGVNRKNPELMDVLLVASRRENIEDRVAALELAGLKADVIDVEPYAIENVLNLILDCRADGDPGRTIAVADVGASMMMLSVISGGRSVYVREHGFGGKELTEGIQRQYGLSSAEAGLAKKLGGLPEGYMAEVLDPFRQAMAQQINVSLQFFRSSSANRGIDSLVLAGGCASTLGIREYVESALGVPTMIANPFANMSMSSRVSPQTLRNEAPALMVACGLALRSFD